MKLFACQSCQQLIFFESVACVRCGHRLAYLPDRGLVSALADAGGGLWRTVPTADFPEAHYRLCANATAHGVCNWAVPAEDPLPFCRACRLNEVIPDLSVPAAKTAWARIELAKRRLVYSLLELGLPVVPKAEDPEHGLAFAFLRDGSEAGAPKTISTGHNDGVITLNVAEADDAHREKTRVELGEPYRTLLGHFRHEVGHYYWARLIEGGRWLARFRDLFGDERADYAEAQQRHYGGGAPADWPNRFVSAYASMHPWEDWAETWAHYLHMTDTLETARAHGLSVRPRPADGGGPRVRVLVRRLDLGSFDDIMAGWTPLTLALNDLNRSMGQPDHYPFVLPPPALEKLRFVHDLVHEVGGAR